MTFRLVPMVELRQLHSFPSVHQKVALSSRKKRSYPGFASSCFSWSLCDRNKSMGQNLCCWMRTVLVTLEISHGPKEDGVRGIALSLWAYWWQRKFQQGAVQPLELKEPACFPSEKWVQWPSSVLFSLPLMHPHCTTYFASVLHPD